MLITDVQLDIDQVMSHLPDELVDHSPSPVQDCVQSSAPSSSVSTTKENTNMDEVFNIIMIMLQLIRDILTE